MPTVVHCQDSSKATAERERSYDAHIEYLGTIRSKIRFAGPLAMADNARAQGDVNVVGSLFVIDEPVSVTFDLMQGDPYVKSGVWDRVAVFQAVKSYGPWSAGMPLKTSGRLYAALASAAGPPLAAAPAVLFGAELELRHMPGEATSAIWRAVAIFSANSLEEARSNILQETAYRNGKIDSWSVPISVGTWTQLMKAT